MDLFKGKKRKNGAPDRIRTSDLPLRRRLLYPTELPGRDNGLITLFYWAERGIAKKNTGAVKGFCWQQIVAALMKKGMTGKEAQVSWNTSPG